MPHFLKRVVVLSQTVFNIRIDLQHYHPGLNNLFPYLFVFAFHQRFSLNRECFVKLVMCSFHRDQPCRPQVIHHIYLQIQSKYSHHMKFQSIVVGWSYQSDFVVLVVVDYSWWLVEIDLRSLDFVDSRWFVECYFDWYLDSYYLHYH